LNRLEIFRSAVIKVQPEDRIQSMPEPDQRLTLLLLMLVFSLLLLSACGSQTPTTIHPTPSQTVSVTNTPVAGQNGEQSILDLTGLDVVPTLAGIAPSRTPEPTATPDVLTLEIARIAQKTGFSNKTLFWLDIVDWISLGISLLIVLAGYLLGTWVIHWLLPRLVKRTPTRLDDRLLQVSGRQVRWLVVLVILRFAVTRLDFVNPAIKTFITDICFFSIIFLIAGLFWRLINLGAKQAESQAKKAGQQEETESLITLTVWGLRLVVITIVVSLSLTHFGINITGFAFILGVIVFAISLAGRDILTDIISGAMILIDQPFRIGDRLDLPSIDSWGDVVDIGMRSTKILSVENRMVVLPNSLIGKNQVVNYSYPDPSLFNTLNVRVAYENDPDVVAKIIVDAIRSVEGVDTERDVSAWLYELRENHMLYWANWWVANYQDRFPVQDQVSRAIIRALKEAGIVLPYQSLDIQMDTSSSKPKASLENPNE